MDNSVVISTPPHVKSKRTTRGIMIDVCIALAPCAFAGCVFFGWQALLIILMSVFSCVATEFVYFFIANKRFSNKCVNAKSVCVRWMKQFDFTSVVTGIILALILPTTDKWYEVFYEVIIGAVFSIAIVKMVFGGTGKNLVNPAAAGRVFMAISFAAVTTYTAANFSALEFESGIFTGSTNLWWLLNGRGWLYRRNVQDIDTCRLYLPQRKKSHQMVAAPPLYCGIRLYRGIYVRFCVYSHRRLYLRYGAFPAAHFLRRRAFRRGIYVYGLLYFAQRRIRSAGLLRCCGCACCGIEVSDKIRSYFLCDFAYELSGSAYRQIHNSKTLRLQKNKS